MPVCCVNGRYEFRIQRHKIKTRCWVYIWSFQRSVSSHTVECRVVNVLCKNHHIFPNVEWAAVTKQTQQRESGRHQWVYYQFPVIQDSYTIHKSNSLIPNTLLSHTQLDKCVCVLICMSMCIYVYVYLHIHIYTHTYNFILFPSSSYFGPCRHHLHNCSPSAETHPFYWQASLCKYARCAVSLWGHRRCRLLTFWYEREKIKIWHIVTDLHFLQSQIKG